MSVTETVHEPVLLQEIVEALTKSFTKAPFIYLDGTLGGAGHAKAILDAIQKKSSGDDVKNIIFIGLDRDPQSISRAHEYFDSRHNSSVKIILEQRDYRNLDQALEENGIKEVDRILLDLGISSDELDNSCRGFSFQRDEPLLMTMGDPASYPFTAKTIVNSWDEEVIANIIYGYSEDRFARRIARSIVHYRTKKEIETSTELAEIVKSAVPAFVRRGKIHPATKTFQALRIAVNDELGALKEGLPKAFEKLRVGGILAVISFHSLEDRIVKNFMRENAVKCQSEILTKKPIIATKEETEKNPRARSARLRLMKK